MIAFGGSPAAVAKMWRIPGDNSPAAINTNPMHKTLAHLCEDFYRQQLHPGNNLDVLQKGFLQIINASLLWENIPENVILSSMPTEKQVSLLGCCRHVLLDAATRSFFGDRLLEIQPDLFKSFFDFDDNSWQLKNAAKKTGMDALREYFMLPKEERKGEAWLVRNLEAEMRNVGIEEPDIAAFVMMIYWV